MKRWALLLLALVLSLSVTAFGESYSNDEIGVHADFGEEWTVNIKDYTEGGITYELAVLKYDPVTTVTIDKIDAGEEITDDLLESLIGALENNMKTSLENAGATDIILVREDIDFLGAQRVSFRVEVTIQGFRIYERYLMIPAATEVYEIAIAVYNTDTADQLLAVFY